MIAGPALRAMRTAERVFATTSDPPGLLQTAAEALALQPGHACLISLVEPDGAAGVLRPVWLAHARPSAIGELRAAVLGAGAGPSQASILASTARTTAGTDAFSRAVQRTGGTLRMQLDNPRLWRLWLPRAYWPYADEVHIKAVLASALCRHGQVVGTLLLWREGETAEPFTAADQAYVAAMAARLALGIV